MERIDGPQMVDAIARRPWAALALADQLAELHVRLHHIEAPTGFRPAQVTPAIGSCTSTCTRST